MENVCWDCKYCERVGYYCMKRAINLKDLNSDECVIDFTECFKPLERVNDEINSPKHYTQGKIETIDYIEDMGYIEGNIIKYISRYKFKGKPIEDLKKARWYIDRLIKKEEELK